MKNYLLLAGMTALAFGCAAVPPAPLVKPERTGPQSPTKVAPTAVAPSPNIDEPTETTQSALTKSQEKAELAPPSISDDTTLAQGPSPSEELAVLVVHSGALITQVNGDSSLRCMQPDCRIPLPPGTHRVAVKYRDTATRGGSTVTYASMYPRIVEINLEPGHHYSVTASGRYSHKWWISIEDQTTNKTVYNDRDKPQ